MTFSTSIPRPIGVGIAGLSATGGWAADAHVPALAVLDDYELRALSASSSESARAAGAKYDVPLTFGSVEELVQCDEVDLVVVTVKVADHHRLALSALDAGKMVLCEWPLARGLAEAEDLAAVAHERRVRTAVGLQGRSAPAVRYLRDLIAEGYVGDVLSTTVLASGAAWGATFHPRFAYTLDREAGNTMLGVAVGHLTDALAMCLGEFTDVNATMANRRPQVRNSETGELASMTTDDQVVINGLLEGGAVASLHFRGGLSQGTNLLWEINGTEGDLLVRADWGYVQHGSMSIQGARAGALADLPVPDRYNLVPKLANRQNEMYYTVAHAYAELLKDVTEGTTRVPTFADGVQRHRLLDQIQRAATTGERQGVSRASAKS